MGEDKLTHRERVRLEAFSQAVNSAGPGRSNLNDHLDRAAVIEKWLLTGAIETPAR